MRCVLITPFGQPVEKAGAERADADARPARQLEVLGQAAVEGKTLAEVVPIDETERVPGAVESLLVECLCRKLRLTPISRRDVGAAEARLELVADRRELELHPRHRDADMA